MARTKSARKPVAKKDRRHSEKGSHGIEQAEYEEVRVERQLFDFAGWTSAVRARKEMPSWFAKQPHPSLKGLVGKRFKAATFIGSDARHVVVRRAEPSMSPTIELHVVTVEANVSAMPGTLILPVSAEDLKDVDPRSLALHLWDQ